MINVAIWPYASIQVRYKTFNAYFQKLYVDILFPEKLEIGYIHG